MDILLVVQRGLYFWGSYCSSHLLSTQSAWYYRQELGRVWYKLTSQPVTAPGTLAEDKKHPCQTQRTLLLPAHVAPCLSCCCCPPSPMKVMWSSPGGRCTHSGSASQLRNPWRIFIMDYKLTCTNFCLQGRHYIY